MNRGPRLYLIAINVRSAHNVGSLLRTADGLNLTKVILCGYTPYPNAANDTRLPHVADSITARISKTALGAEHSQPWEYIEDGVEAVQRLKKQRVKIVALEQSESATNLLSYQPACDVALLVGSEVNGLSQEILALSDRVVEIPMLGKKESFNVSVAAAMALFHIRYR